MAAGDMAVHLIYETHATTGDNERGVATGWLPGVLSATGREQAATLGRRYPDGAIDVACVSDLARAVETAMIAFAGRAVSVVRDPRLRECDYGDSNGAAAEQVAADRRDRIDQPFPGGESYRDVVRRTGAFLRDLAHDHDGQRVLVIAHSANRWALAELLGGVPLGRSMDEPFTWQPGWHYVIPDGYGRDDGTLTIT